MGGNSNSNSSNTFNEVYEETLKYFNGNELSTSVWMNKYCLKDNNGNYLEKNPDYMHKRLANEFARIDSEKYNLKFNDRYELYYDSFKNFSRIVPQGSVMSAVGNKHQKLSSVNCVVVESPKDNIGSIIDSGKTLAQLFKRRCVEENSFVLTKEKGCIPIKYVEKGMHVLSFDINTKKSLYKKIIDKFYTEVVPKNRVIVKYSNGTILKTSKKHPILFVDEKGYSYKNVEDLKIGDTSIRVSIKDKFLYREKNKNITNIGWFIGAHIGDDSCDISKKNKSYRFRILGDNENVVKNYCEIFNKLAETSANYHKSYRSDYKIDCWEFCSSRTGNKDIILKFFDNQHGSKTYTAKVPKYIIKNNLWWPFIAGLIDTDGTIRKNQIVISICASSVIDSITSFLQSYGVSTHITIFNNVRKNESTLYCLHIHYSYNVWKILSNLMYHELKISILNQKINEKKHKYHSRKRLLLKEEFESIINNFNDIKEKRKYPSLQSNIYDLKNSNEKGIGIASTYMFENFHLLDENKKLEILQRIKIYDVSKDLESTSYIDIEVEDTNNFYCGNFGLVSVHNCGIGLDISTLRPEGTSVSNASRTTTGAWSFADFYSYITRMIGQGSRRGALMLTMDVCHPDIIKFVTSKHDRTKVTGANISVKLNNKFLKAVENNEEYEQRWISKENPNLKVINKINAKDIWKVIVNSATKTADPGLIFWDSIKENLPADYYKELETICVNPCSEIPLGAFDSCRLISINLTGYVENPFEKNKCYFDIKKFKKDVQLAVHLLDNLLDLEFELISEIKKVCVEGFEKDLWDKFENTGRLGRRIGLGTHGLADTLSQLCLKYDSSDSIKMIDHIYKVLRNEAYKYSIELAKSRGAFPLFNWNNEKNCAFIKRLPKELQSAIKKYGRRNVALLTQAPTGSVSIISKSGKFNKFNISSGIEPVFRNSYIRRKKINPGDNNAIVDYVDVLGDKWQNYMVYHSNVENYIEKYNSNKENLPDYFISSDKIDWQKRIEIQATEQQYIDHAISSTINLPRGTNSETVEKIYFEAWKKGLKGITVYVDGCKDAVLITDDSYTNSKSNSNGKGNFIQHDAYKRPKELECNIHHAIIKGEKWTIFIGLLENKPYEVFGGLSSTIEVPKKYKTGIVIKHPRKTFASIYDLKFGEKDDEFLVKNIVKSFDNPTYGSFTRTISLSLRHGVPVQFLCEQLLKDEENSDMFSFSKAISRVLKNYVPNGSKVSGFGSVCWSCNANDVIYEEGCYICKSCGSSKCS